jgi:ATP-dependent DNA ligase
MPKPGSNIASMVYSNAGNALELPLTERREILRATVVPNEHVQIVEVAHSAKDMLRFVTEHKLEGIIVKRADSKYPPAKRTGLG